MHAYSQVTFTQPDTAAYSVASSVTLIAHLLTSISFRLPPFFKTVFLFPAAILPAAGLGQQMPCAPNIPEVCADPCRVGGKVWCLKPESRKEDIREKGGGFPRTRAKVGNVPLLLCINLAPNMCSSSYTSPLNTSQTYQVKAFFGMSST